MACKFSDKKTGSGVRVNEVLAQELHKLVINLKEEVPMQDLKIIFGQQILLTWNLCLLTIRVLNICYLS